MFHSYGDVAITSEGLQILTYARHSWPLSSKGSLACTPYCDTGHLFIMVISEDSWYSHYCQTFSNGSVTNCFYELGLTQLRFENLTFRLRGQRSNPLRHSRTNNKVKHYKSLYPQIYKNLKDISIEQSSMLIRHTMNQNTNSKAILPLS